MTDFFDRLADDRLGAELPQEVERQEAPPEPVELGRGAAISHYTSSAIKLAAQELLRAGVIDQTKARLYKTAVSEANRLAEIFEPLDLQMHLDEVRGLAFLGVADWIQIESDDGGWTHPLLRRQRLTLEQSLLVAILRRFFVTHEQETGIGAGDARIALEDVAAQLDIFLPDTGSDQRNEQRLRNLLEQLRGHGLISEVDREETIIIRPLIAHLANPQTLSNLLDLVKSLGRKDTAVASHPDESSS